MKRIVIVFVALLMPAVLFGQNKQRFWAGAELSGSYGVADVNNPVDDDLDDSYNPSTIDVNALGGIYLFKRLSLGVGTGISYFNAPDMVYCPVFGDLRFFFRKMDVKPLNYYMYGRAGVPILLSRSGKGSIAEAGFGSLFSMNGRPFQVSLGYSYNQFKYTSQGHHLSPERHSVTLKFGIMF